MDSSFDRPSRFLQWAHTTFGDIAIDPRERGLRFLEEAIELALALGIDPGTARAIVARVYSRPAGGVPREIGQALATLEMLAKVVKIDADSEADQEFFRVQKIPADEWAKRHAAKVALGIAS